MLVKPGKVIWITGLTGSGKTTVSKYLNDMIRELGLPVVLLDGDALRSALGRRWGYTPDERRDLASVYSHLCKLISDGGSHVICATVAMYEDVRKWNRSNIHDYYEVYLRAPLDELRARDQKGLYTKFFESDDPESVFSREFELPENPDLIIDNFGATSALEAAKLAFSGIVTQNIDSAAASAESHQFPNLRAGIVKYWNSYYSQRKAPSGPSNFAVFCRENYITPGSKVLEFGCGNGRDSFYFAKDCEVLGIDASDEVIRFNTEYAKENNINSIKFLPGYFGDITIPDSFTPDFIYSRFVLHAMDEHYENSVLQLSRQILRSGGMFVAEFRSINDPLAEEGMIVGENERITDHYRRFINVAAMTQKLTKLGFEIVFSAESKGFAPHKDEDPVCGRIIAKLG